MINNYSRHVASMANTPDKRPCFQLSLFELQLLVFLTVCIAGLVNYAISSETSVGRKAVILISTTIGTSIVSLIFAWLMKTGRQMWFVWIVGVPTLILFAAAVVLPQYLRCSCGGHQTAAAAACNAYAEAQEIFHRTDWDGDGCLEYAQDMQDLIDHKIQGDGIMALIDRAFANADARLSEPVPQAGYFFRQLLFRQVDGKPRSFIINGNMIEGYAVVAFPSEYDVTARDTFLISSAGTIYQQDLGPDTAAIAGRMMVFDVSPGTGWVATE